MQFYVNYLNCIYYHRSGAQDIERSVRQQCQSVTSKCCSQCNSIMSLNSIKPPSVLWLHVEGSASVSADEFPPVISIESNYFAVRGFIIHRPGHFTSIIKYQDNFFYFDNLKKTSIMPYRGGLIPLYAIVLVRIEPS